MEKEKQRSLSLKWKWKPTRFLLLSLTLSFSFVLFSFFSFWALRLHSPSSVLLLNTPSVSFTFNLNPLNLRSFTAPFTDSSVFPVNSTNFTHTHFTQPHTHTSSANITIARLVGDVGGGGTKLHQLKAKDFSDLVTNFSLDGIKDSSLRDTPLRKLDNSSGFVKSSIFKEYELHSKANIEEIRKSNESVFVESSNSEDKGDVGEVGKLASKHGSDTEKREPDVYSMGKVDKENCDVSKGKWVFDESYPLYTNLSCPFIDEGFNCQGNGRHDTDYMKWRWKPQDCDIPRFNATNMLELIRGKRLVFVGDSINRNQWESLLCLLMLSIKDPTKVYETHGRRITKEKGIYSFRFVDYQCTVEFYVTHFLVHETKARIGRKRKETLRIDSMDKGSSRWRGADILIFNTGNWWSHFKTKAGINYYQEGKQVYPHLDALIAYRKALMTWATWVDRHVNPHKTHVFFRSTAPAHFRGGQWNTGGHCREMQKPLDEMYIDHSEKNVITQEVIRKMKTPITFLNVTGLSSYRIDGHPSKYGRSPGKRGSSIEDCSHWCLPGVPDAWNELIYHQLLLKRKKKAYNS